MKITEDGRLFASDVQIYGNVKIGEGVQISGPCDINGNDCEVILGEGVDVGAFTAINCADSSDRCLGLSTEIKRAPISIGHHTFIGSHCLIKGGVTIGHHCKVAGGTVVDPGVYPDYSLIYNGTVARQYKVLDTFRQEEQHCTLCRTGYYRERCEGK